MRYQPTDLPNRSHVGDKWTRYQLRSLQTILQATHGIVSGEPDFFRTAFGDIAEDFEQLLLRPHHMIFNREYYDVGDGKSRLEHFKKGIASLSGAQRSDLLEFVSRHDPSRYAANLRSVKDRQTRSVLRHYVPPPKSFERPYGTARGSRRMSP